MSDLKHTQELDGLRGVAVLAVIFAHFHSLFGVRFGAPGVDVFFTLSGFLITRILVTEIQTTSSISISNFYARRMLRLAPALVAMVTCVAAFYLAWGIPAWRVAEFSIPALFYFSNWVRAFELWGLGALGHTWSLAIEEQFYILWPLVFLIAARILKTEQIVWFCLALAVAVIAHRLNMLDGGASSMRIQNGFDTRADTILIGAALGIFASYRSISFAWLPYAAAAGAAFLLFALVYEPTWYYQYGTTGIALATGCIIANATAGGKDPTNVILRNRFLLYSGKISYGLYLWHFPIKGLFWMAVGVKGFSPFALQIVDLCFLLPLTYVVCQASYQWIESPALRLKQRFVAHPRQLEAIFR